MKSTLEDEIEFDSEDDEMVDLADEDDKSMAASSVALVHSESAIRDVILLAADLGGNSDHNRKAAHSNYRAVVSEVYSPPRVAQAA